MMKRFSNHLFSGFIGLSLFMVSPVRGEISRKPYIQNVQKTSAFIFWESDQAGEPKVRFGPNEKAERTVQAQPVQLEAPKPQGDATQTSVGPKPETFPPPTAHVYKAKLEGLIPGQDVYYQVEDAGQWTPVQHFRTMPDQAEKFRFVVYGDTRTFPDAHTAVAGQILKAQPDFIIHTGDLVAAGQDYRQWTQQFFHPMEQVLDHVPLWPTPGNHEGDGANYRHLFDFPSPPTPAGQIPQPAEFNYSFDYGFAHFSSINSVGMSPEQDAEWLDHDLSASKAKWKFVYYHYPTYNAGGHGSAWGRGVMTPIFRKHHVDVVFTGHSHLYERTKPIKSGYPDNPWPVLYVVTGGGGAPLYELKEADYLAKSVKAWHAMVVDLDGDRLACRVISNQGEEIDSFTLDKSPATFKAYADSAIIEELTDLKDLWTAALEKPAPQANAGETVTATFPFANRLFREPIQVSVKVERGEWVKSVGPESVNLTLAPGEEKTLEFKVTPTINTAPSVKLAEADPKMAEQFKAASKPAPGGGRAVPLVRLVLHYQTAFGQGDLVVPALLIRGI